MHFAEKLKAAREAAGLSQEQFAEALGISRQAVSKWETAQSYPDTENLMAAAQILGLSVDELALEQVRDRAARPFCSAPDHRPAGRRRVRPFAAMRAGRCIRSPPNRQHPLPHQICHPRPRTARTG